MLPLWIIDLGVLAASNKKLRDLFDSTGEELQPYWHYHHLESRPIPDAESCKVLMDDLIADGRDCYNAFIKAGYQVSNFQIVILGSADEHFTQSIFAPLAGLIRDNLPRIISEHANLGVEITGILYIPSTINQLDDLQERTNAAMFLEEVNILNERLGSKHYNRVIAYQDIQYKGARFYSQLNTEQRNEFLYQILVNLFFVSATSERLFDKIGKESGIFSLGVVSIYYNSELHHDYELKRLLDKLLAEFKEPENSDNEYATKIALDLFKEDAINTETVSARLREKCSSLDIDLKKMDEEANPHPIWDLFLSDLIPIYYKKFLKYMPARLIRFMHSLKYILLTRFSDIIRRNREQSVEHFKNLLYSIYRKVFLDKATQYATIGQIESVFKAIEDILLKKRSKVTMIILEIVPIPKYLRNDYDKCVTNEEANKPSTILENIKKNLKKEPIVLSMVIRCFLLGILLVFTIVPILRVISPNVINLGEIATIEWLWIPILFFLPLIINFFIKLRRHFKRIKRLKYRLLATTLLSINKRLSKILVDEQSAFYDALIHECESQLELLTSFREGLIITNKALGKTVIPETMFNQPLLGGDFCGEKLMKDESASEAEIRVKEEKRRLSELEKEDILTLLKASFNQPETLDAADLSDDKIPAEHAKLFISVLENLFSPQLHIHTAENMGLMLTLLGNNINLSPFEKMAGINGMLFSVSSCNPPVLRITNVPKLFEGMDVIADRATTDYALLTSWQKIPQGIQARLVCNCSLDSLPALSFADRLSLYYAFYRRKDLAYTIAGIPIQIPKEEMDQLDKQIIGG